MLLSTMSLTASSAGLYVSWGLLLVWTATVALVLIAVPRLPRNRWDIGAAILVTLGLVAGVLVSGAVAP